MAPHTRFRPSTTDVTSCGHTVAPKIMYSVTTQIWGRRWLVWEVTSLRKNENGSREAPAAPAHREQAPPTVHLRTPIDRVFCSNFVSYGLIRWDEEKHWEAVCNNSGTEHNRLTGVLSLWIRVSISLFWKRRIRRTPDRTRKPTRLTNLLSSSLSGRG